MIFILKDDYNNKSNSRGETATLSFDNGDKTVGMNIIINLNTNSIQF